MALFKHQKNGRNFLKSFNFIITALYVYSAS